MLGKDASRQNIKALHETRAMRQWASDMSSTSLFPENCAGARGWRGWGFYKLKKSPWFIIHNTWSSLIVNLAMN